MIYACKWLIRKCPNVLVMLAGIWIAALPFALDRYVHAPGPYIIDPASGKKVPVLVQASPLMTRIDDLLDDIYHSEVFMAVVFFLGCAIALAGFIRLLRQWLEPLERKVRGRT